MPLRDTVRGSGTGSKNSTIAFESLRENPRAALLLANETVYLTWGSSCDVGPYHGWVMAYDAGTLQQKTVFNASPDADDSGIWASDTGPAQIHKFCLKGSMAFTLSSRCSAIRLA